MQRIYFLIIFFLSSVTVSAQGTISEIPGYYAEYPWNLYWNNGWKYKENGPAAHLKIGDWNTKSDFIFYVADVNNVGQDQPAILNEVIRFAGTGNIGIGTANPQNKLQIGVNNVDWHGNDLVVSNPAGSIAIHNTPTESLISGEHTLTLKSGSALGVAVIANGNVGIGTLNPTAKLSIDGTALAKKVKVSQAASDWPDYVFDSSYQLPSLDSVSSFIQINKHLPDMPSAAVVEKDGHDLGEVQKLLLKKMEEMTLYMIELKKENETLKTKVEALTKKMKTKNNE